MAVARAARAALALALASVAGSARAQAVARPVVAYPLGRGEGAAADDAQALLESALRRAVNRSEDVVLSEPVFVRPSCGPAQTAPVECLARLAGNGLLLRAVLHRSERSAAMAVEAVDGTSGKLVGPVTVGIDTYIQNAEPLARALLLLFDDARRAARRAAGASAMPRPAVIPSPLTPVQPKQEALAEAPPPSSSSRADLHAAEPEPEQSRPAASAAAAKPAAATAAKAEPRRSWMRSAAPWVAGAGLALLAGAAGVAVANQSLADELDRKYHDGTLTPADAASYDKVEQNNKLTVILAASGGALTLASAYMFTVVPSQGGGAVAIAGRF